MSPLPFELALALVGAPTPFPRWMEKSSSKFDVLMRAGKLSANALGRMGVGPDMASRIRAVAPGARANSALKELRTAANAGAVPHAARATHLKPLPQALASSGQETADRLRFVTRSGARPETAADLVAERDAARRVAVNTPNDPRAKGSNPFREIPSHRRLEGADLAERIEAKGKANPEFALTRGAMWERNAPDGLAVAALDRPFNRLMDGMPKRQALGKGIPTMRHEMGHVAQSWLARHRPELFNRTLYEPILRARRMNPAMGQEIVGNRLLMSEMQAHYLASLGGSRNAARLRAVTNGTQGLGLPNLDDFRKMLEGRVLHPHDNATMSAMMHSLRNYRKRFGPVWQRLTTPYP